MLCWSNKASLQRRLAEELGYWDTRSTLLPQVDLQNWFFGPGGLSLNEQRPQDLS